jgi:DNA mismatch repair protein MutL
MGNIHLLSSSLQNQISAGEVVERPASIIKELLENALDAAAKNITLEIDNGGVDHIRIIDDGIGMDEKDAEMAFERHATSKIRTSDDLFSLHSFGFRGEALASIASVAEIEMITRRKEDFHGTKIVITSEGRKKTHSASPEGTDISIKKLFYTVPARRKFLKSESTEFRECMKVIEAISIANPQTSFNIRKNGKTVGNFFAYFGEQSYKNRIREVLGKNATEELFPIHFLGSQMQMSGFAGHPHWNRRDRSLQYIFVNTRPVARDSNILAAVTESYRSLIPHGSYPIFVLFIQIDPSLVDVNVHPRKSEVKFVYPKEVFMTVKGAFETALKTSHSPEKLPSFLNSSLKENAEMATSSFSGKKFLSPPSLSLPAFSRLPYQKNIPSSPPPLSFREFSKPKSEVQNSSLPSRDFTSRKIIGQLRKSFILIEEEDGLLVVDQHAAHERVRYEWLIKAVREKKAKSQRLLLPVVFSISHSSKTLLEEYEEILVDLGFQVEPFGGSEIAIYAVPEGNKKFDIESLFRALLDDLESITPEEAKATKILAERIATFAACRGSIKFGDALSMPEMEALIDSLDKCNAFYSCAHGRPIAMKISFEEMEKMCGR